jgi:hypothetical protein
MGPQSQTGPVASRQDVRKIFTLRGFPSGRKLRTTVEEDREVFLGLRCLVSSKRSRILIADDHILVADLCEDLLETEFKVIVTVSSGRAMVPAAAELHPDDRHGFLTCTVSTVWTWTSK